MKIFKPYCHEDFIGCYRHINAVPSDRITLSYGFYNRTNQNTRQTGFVTVQNGCVFNFPFGVGWYFGVNLRIKCQQQQAKNQKNIAIATSISQKFCKYTIPHYINTHNDQGVEDRKSVV